MPNINDKVNLQQGVVVETTLPFNVSIVSETMVAEIENTISQHNQLAFDIANAFITSDNNEIRDKSSQYKALEYKLTTILHLLRFLLAAQHPVVGEYQIKLSALAVEWDSKVFLDKPFSNSKIANVEKSQKLYFDFYPSSQFPWPIKRIAEVTEVNGSIIKAQFLPVDMVSDEHFSKWVFQLHRRSIQKQKN